MCQLRDNVRRQAEFLNYITDDWGLRIIYPELPIMMLKYFELLEYKNFDDLSETEKKGVINFFSCEESYVGLESSTDQQIKEIRELHKKWNRMPTMEKS